VGAGGEQPGARRLDRAPHRAERLYGLAGTATDTGDQFDLTGMELSLDRSVDLIQSGQHRTGRVRLSPGDRIDEEQLLLDTEGEWVGGPLDDLVFGSQARWLPGGAPGKTSALTASMATYC